MEFIRPCGWNLQNICHAQITREASSLNHEVNQKLVDLASISALLSAFGLGLLHLLSLTVFLPASSFLFAMTVLLLPFLHWFLLLAPALLLFLSPFPFFFARLFFPFPIVFLSFVLSLFCPFAFYILLLLLWLLLWFFFSFWFSLFLFFLPGVLPLRSFPLWFFSSFFFFPCLFFLLLFLFFLFPWFFFLFLFPFFLLP